MRERGFGAEKVSGWMDASKSGRKKIIKGGLVIRLLITGIMSQKVYCATSRIYSYGNTYNNKERKVNAMNTNLLDYCDSLAVVQKTFLVI